LKLSFFEAELIFFKKCTNEGIRISNNALTGDKTPHLVELEVTKRKFNDEVEM